MENYFFTKLHHFRERRFITRYQVSFYANNYFEKLPQVSTAFKTIKKVITVFFLLVPFLSTTLRQGGAEPLDFMRNLGENDNK